MAMDRLIPGQGAQQAAAHARMAVMLANQNRFGEAIIAFRQAAQADPLNPQIHFALGSCYAATGNVADAIQSFKHTVTLKPDHGDAHFRLGSMLSETGKIAEGFAHYMRRATLVHGGPTAPVPKGPEPLHKTKHDREQQEYLKERLGHRAPFHLENGERIGGRLSIPPTLRKQ